MVIPGSGPAAGGTRVEILGIGLQNATAVSFGDTPAASFEVLNEYQIVAVSPPHPEGKVHVTVRTPLGTSLTADCGDSFDAASLGPGRPKCDQFHFYDEPSGGSFGDVAVPPSGARGRLATALSTGMVLVTGGCIRNGDACAPTAQTELYNPATNTWTSCPSQGTADAGCPAPSSGVGYSTATLLKDGKVLLAGGVGRSAEIFDPATGKWSDAGDMTTSRSFPTTTLLNDGRVLMLGGEPPHEVRTAELYDPETGLWAATPPPVFAVGSGWTATLLATGDVLAAGGRASYPSPDSTQKAELFRPASRAEASVWTPTGPPTQSRFGHTATPLTTGEVLVTGGSFADGAVTFSASEIYDPESRLWRQTARLGEARAYHAAFRLTNGKVLVVGGNGRYGPPPAAELYDPAAGRWKYAAFMPEGLHSITASALIPAGPKEACGRNCGKVLIGGETGEYPSLFPSWALFAPAPEVADITPAAGSTRGGDRVTVTGSGLASVSSVKFDGVEAESISTDTGTPDTKIAAVSPAHVAGAVDVTVTADGGSARAGGFTYTVPSATGGDEAASGNPRAGGGGVSAPATDGAQPGSGRGAGTSDRVAAREASRLRRLRRCLGQARGHSRRERRLVRRRCVARWGRIPGRVREFRARARSRSEIVLSFRAPGTDRSRPPAARAYLVKQSTRPIRGRRGFRRARTLCNGSCRFSVERVGTRIRLAVTDLRPNTTYYYAIAARDNVSRRLGPRSRTVSAKTR